MDPRYEAPNAADSYGKAHSGQYPSESTLGRNEKVASAGGGKDGVPQQKDFKTQAEYEAAYYGYYNKDDPRAKGAADKGAAIVSPANSGGGNSNGGGGNSSGPRSPQQAQPQGPPPLTGPRWTAQQEADYLAANPDVARGIQAGTMDSAQGHYERHGKGEGRKMTNAVVAATAPVAAANAAKEAELASLRAAAAARDARNKEISERDSMISGLGASVYGVGAGGEQRIRLTGNLPKTMSEQELRSLAARNNFGYDAVALAYRDSGGSIADWKPTTPEPTTPATTPSASFDEAGYLASNPDVAAAVARGEYKSGQDHYNQRGKDEVRPGGRAFTEAELADRATWPTGNPSTPSTPSVPATAPVTPTRSPQDERGISPRQGDQDGQGNIYDARSGKWVPYVAPTAPVTTPASQAPVSPTINTGQNADSNIVAAGRFIETLPGGTGAWEYNEIENVVENRLTGERKPVPSASLPKN